MRAWPLNFIHYLLGVALALGWTLAAAGLSPDHWSDSLRVSRYRTESFGEA